MESKFLKPPGKTQIGSRNREFEKLGVKLQCSTEEGKQLLVRVIGRFEKMRVREIGIPLYPYIDPPPEAFLGLHPPPYC